MANLGSIYTTQSATSSAILTSAGTALAANTSRLGWFIQNLGTNPLFVYHGSGASTTVFTTVLKACSVADDGSGASASQEEGVVYNGIITVAGTSPRFVATEWAPL